MKQLTFAEFVEEVKVLARQQNWRIGQALFNLLMVYRPDLSEHLRGSVADPFFSETPTDPRYTRAFNLVKASWINPEVSSGD